MPLGCKEFPLTTAAAAAHKIKDVIDMAIENEICSRARALDENFYLIVIIQFVKIIEFARILSRSFFLFFSEKKCCSQLLFCCCYCCCQVSTGLHCVKGNNENRIFISWYTSAGIRQDVSILMVFISPAPTPPPSDSFITTSSKATHCCVCCARRIVNVMFAINVKARGREIFRPEGSNRSPFM